MQLQSTKKPLGFLFVIIFSCLVALIYFFPTTAVDVPAQSKPAEKLRLSAQPQLTSQKTPSLVNDRKIKEACTPKHVFDKNPNHVVVEQWQFDNLGFGKVDYANYLNEEQLLDQANAGDVRAMYVLGTNYRWHATMESFQSIFIRPKEYPPVEYKERPLVNKVMTQARFWLIQAAYYGHVGALESLAYSYDKEAAYFEKQQHNRKQQIQTLRMTSIAYSAMQAWLLPDLAPFLKQYDTSILNNNELAEFNDLLLQNKRRWLENRKALGLDPKWRLAVPKELWEIQLQRKNLCVE